MCGIQFCFIKNFITEIVDCRPCSTNMASSNKIVTTVFEIRRCNRMTLPAGKP